MKLLQRARWRASLNSKLLHRRSNDKVRSELERNTDKAIPIPIEPTVDDKPGQHTFFRSCAAGARARAKPEPSGVNYTRTLWWRHNEASAPIYILISY